MSVSLIYIRQSTPLTILRLAKPALEFSYVTAFSSFASTIDSRVLTPGVLTMSSRYCARIEMLLLLAIACMDTSLSEANYQQKGSCHQEPVRVPSHIPTGYILVQWLRQMTDPLVWLLFIGAKYTVICNWVVLPYVKQRISRTTPDVWIQGPICPDRECLVKQMVDSYKSIRSSGLRYIDYWLSTFLSNESAYLKMS